jgi:ParB family chromosome partitioning protein
MSGKKSVLGRGLAELSPFMAQHARTPVPAVAPEPPQLPGDRLAKLPLDLLQRGKYQPRVDMREESLNELAQSIKSQGLVQPILVRPLPKGAAGETQRYEIIAGERRWRAAQKAGPHQIPALVKDLGDEAAFEVALIENLQRQDLDPLEEAEAYRRLCEEHGLTQEEAAKRVGKDRSSVANAMRLLRLPQEIRAAIAAGELDMGHARALLAVRDEARLLKLGRLVIERGLSVREVERLARGDRSVAGKPSKSEPSPTLRREEESLMRALGARVHILERKGKGTIQIDFSNHQEYARLSELLLHKAGR